LKSVNDSYSLSIIFVKNPSCETTIQSSNQTWIIAVVVIGIVVALTLIFILLALFYPPLKKKIFPHKQEENGNKTDDIIQLTDKVQNLKMEIKDLEDQHQRVVNLLDED